MRHLIMAIGVCSVTVACSGTIPTEPSPALAPNALSLASTEDASSRGSRAASTAAAQPHFNLTAVLKGDGFGLVKLRQEKDPTQDILYMDVWVRDLLPNTSYALQRAVDSPRDGVCTGTTWLTMGQGATPQPIVTDESGTGRATLWRPVPATALPSDIHFRVIQTGTSNVTLHSDCYPLLLRD